MKRLAGKLIPQCLYNNDFKLLKRIVIDEKTWVDRYDVEIKLICLGGCNLNCPITSVEYDGNALCSSTPTA